MVPEKVDFAVGVSDQRPNKCSSKLHKALHKTSRQTVAFCSNLGVTTKSVKSVVTNATRGDVELWEGIVGIFGLIDTISRNGTYTIVCNPNATHREYDVVKVPPAGDPLVISTDDCLKNSAFTVFDDEDGTIKLEKVSRTSSNVAVKDWCTIL